MQNIEALREQVRTYKMKNGLSEINDDRAIMTLHLKNLHRLDLHAAQDQSSAGSNDHGIDGWHFDEKTGALFIYQSKLSATKNYVLQGFTSLQTAVDWLTSALVDSAVEPNYSNPCLANLVMCLSMNRDAIKLVALVLVSPFNDNELDACPEYKMFEAHAVKSRLNSYLTERVARLKSEIQEYCTDGSLPESYKKYSVDVSTALTIELRPTAHLRVTYVSLYSLVELLRRRGNYLFDKNIRLFLNTKEAKRIQHPMEDTLTAICTGRLSENIFPFYHVGVTLTTSGYDSMDPTRLSLETPFIINGCQTLTIAKAFLEKLEKGRKVEEIDRFKRIRVIAKIVTGATDGEIREITNCNNNQNPVESWQLYSNDQVHIEIEEALKDVGVFYERQKGKFDATMRDPRNHKYYPQTTNTYIGVEGLGQIICVGRRQLNLAAKPSDIFGSKDVHDPIFSSCMRTGVGDIIWSHNAYKAAKRALQNYLQQPAYDTEKTHRIFNKPLVKQYMYYLALMYLYQQKAGETSSFSRRLNKIAPATLVVVLESFYRSLVNKTRTWYLKESSDLQHDVSWKKLEGFVTNVCSELGLDSDGKMPFTSRVVRWDEVESADDESAANSAERSEP